MTIYPVESGLFSQTVTVYRKEGQSILRQVIENCCLSREEILQTGLSGCRKERKFLLIVPGEEQTVFPGDRVFEGVGPQITPEQWSGFIPVTEEKLMEVSYAKPYFWQGKLCHVEVGGR